VSISAWAAARTAGEPRATDRRPPPAEVQEIGHRRHGPADEGSGAVNHLGPGLRRRPAGDASMARPDAPLQQPRPPQKQGRPRLDDDVTMWPALPTPPVEQASVEHDPAGRFRRDDHPI